MDRILLQCTPGITKCDSYYKVRRNICMFLDLVSSGCLTVWCIIESKHSSMWIIYCKLKLSFFGIEDKLYLQQEKIKNIEILGKKDKKSWFKERKK